MILTEMCFTITKKYVYFDGGGGKPVLFKEFLGINFELKMLKLLANHDRTQLYEGLFRILNSGNIFENCNLNWQKSDLGAKSDLFCLF